VVLSMVKSGQANVGSPITLGTAQLGMPYAEGKWKRQLMPKLKAFEIIDHAYKNGINSFDTSPDYGCAELRLAEYMKLNPDKKFHIFSKIKDISSNDLSAICQLKKWAINSPFRGLNNCLTLVMLLHNENDLYRPSVVKSLIEMKSGGMISSWGVSIYERRTAKEAIKIPDCEVIQLPFGMFNQSFGSSGTISSLVSKGKSVIARSIFSRGLLFDLSPGKLGILVDRLGTSYLSILKEFEGLVSEHGLNKAKLAIDIALNEPGLRQIVLGADTPEQISDWFDSGESLCSIPSANGLLQKLRTLPNFLDAWD
jgi:aryl-alcohol dehydrogenase-like predicted oxidoreductase